VIGAVAAHLDAQGGDLAQAAERVIGWRGSAERGVRERISEAHIDARRADHAMPRHSEVRQRAVFLSNYDMLMAEQLVHGVDVWVNTPLRPWEASGTSGMKVLVNGGLNLSVLDGWWEEAYSPDIGWAISDEHLYGNGQDSDAADAGALYNTLEEEVIPQFYERDSDGIPQRWVARIRESMARLTPAFSSNRAVRQYTEEYYLRLGAAYRARSANDGALAAGFLEWKAKTAGLWSHLRFGPLHTETRGGRHILEIPVYLSELDPREVRVELYADAKAGHQSCSRI